jgi:hypothetical protein
MQSKQKGGRAARAAARAKSLGKDLANRTLELLIGVYSESDEFIEASLFLECGRWDERESEAKVLRESHSSVITKTKF